MSRLRLVLSAAAFVLLAGCGAAASPDAAPTTQEQAAAVEEDTSPLTGTFTSIENGEIDLASLQGQDVVLWFWAPW